LKNNLIPRGAPDLTCLVRGRQWLSLPGKRVEKGRDIDVNYIQPVYEHVSQTYSRRPGFFPTYTATGYEPYITLDIRVFFSFFC
jgi:hypothetical protein